MVTYIALGAAGCIIGIVIYRRASKIKAVFTGKSDATLAERIVMGLAAPIIALVSAMNINMSSQADNSKNQATNRREQTAKDLWSAAKHLGDDNLNTRLAAIGRLNQILESAPYMRNQIDDTLATYLRANSASQVSTVPLPGPPHTGTAPYQLRTDFQSVLGVLGQEAQDSTVPHLDLQGLDLRGGDLTRLHLDGADLSGAHLEGATLTEASLKSANLSGAHLEGAKLYRADLEGADLNDAYLNGAIFDFVSMQGAFLISVQAQEVRFTEAYLQGADFTGANLQGAVLKGAYLQQANLSGADLRNALFLEAHLNDVDLTDARLNGARELLPSQMRTTIGTPSADGAEKPSRR
jgi:uncharacterized protein YjbI with pentapeptide repeats